MTLHVDCYWSFRSPYSYLATPRMTQWEARYDLRFNVRVVYPLAIRVDGFFERQHPQWLPYLAHDCEREAQRLGIAFGRPVPDPIVMDLVTGKVPQDQPYIRRLTRLGVAAAEAGRGLAFATEVSRLIWAGTTTDWHQGDHLASAAGRAGVALADLDQRIAQEPDRYEGIIQSNQRSHAEAGHWGVPLFSFRNEPFYGQDRMNALLWRLKQQGLKPRAQNSTPSSVQL